MFQLLAPQWTPRSGSKHWHLFVMFHYCLIRTSSPVYHEEVHSDGNTDRYASCGRKMTPSSSHTPPSRQHRSRKTKSSRMQRRFRCITGRCLWRLRRSLRSTLRSTQMTRRITQRGYSTL
eukprot:PhF_6_TR39721/c0_g1_i2/m.59134